MEELGENQYFYSEKTNTYYKVVDLKSSGSCILDYVIQECTIELFTVTQVAIAPDNTKQYKYVEVYEIKPFGRKRKMYYKLLKQLISCDDLSKPIILRMSDKWVYKDII